jgi:hypothetical protein
MTDNRELHNECERVYRGHQSPLVDGWKGQGMRYRKFAQCASHWLCLMTRVLGLVLHGFGGQGSGEVSSRETGSKHVYATLPV